MSLITSDLSRKVIFLLQICLSVRMTTWPAAYPFDQLLHNLTTLKWIVMVHLISLLLCHKG